MDAVDNVVRALDAYLERDPAPYAVMIDGPWGAGKTHFLLETFTRKHPGCGFLYLSLYGMDSASELRRRIADGWSGQDVGGATRLIVRSVDDPPDDQSATITGSYMPAKSRLAGMRRILVLDDIERWHGDLELCLSVVNEVVEHEQAKCVLIGNLDELDPDTQRIFSRSREKTIRHVYRYENTFRNIVDVSLQLVNYGSRGSASFLRALLRGNFATLAAFLERAEIRNIRVLTEALQLFEQVYRHNTKSFRAARQLAFTYLMTMIALLVLTRRYFVEKGSRRKLLKSDHAASKGFKFLSEIGYFSDEAPDYITAESRLMLDTIFYRLDQVSLQGIASIVSNGYYIDEAFAGEFDGWRDEKLYELYLDREGFRELDDKQARRVFNSTNKTLLQARLVTNPLTFLLLAERVADDIADGVVEYDPVEFKRQLIEAADSLYQSGKMKLMDFSVVDVAGNRFQNCRGIYNYLKRRNARYYLANEHDRLISFWSKVMDNRELSFELLDEVSPGIVLMHGGDAEAVMETLEVLDNTQLHRLANWFEAGLDSLTRLARNADGKAIQAELGSRLRARYADQIGVRASHFRRIATILGRADVSMAGEAS